MMTASTIKPFVAAPSASIRARPARASITCSAHKNFNAPAFGLGALAAAQLALGAPAFADVSFDSDKFGAPPQNKDAVNLPSTFFKTGDQLQEKLGFNTDADNLKDQTRGSVPGAPIRNAGNQADAKLDGAVTDIAKGAKKAADNITPDLSELPNPGQLAAKGKSALQDAGSKLPGGNPAGKAADKAKSLGNDLGSKLPNANQLGSKAKSATKGLGSKPI